MNTIIQVGRVSIKNKVFRALWNVVYFLLFRPFGTKLFLPWRMLLLRIFGAKVSKGAGVYSSAKIWAPWNLELGFNAWIGPNVICYNQAMISLGDYVTVSQYSYLCTAGHNTNSTNTPDCGLIVAPITIKHGVWIGTRAFIGMGVVIGENAIVGATASVYKDVTPMSIVGGNPARVLKMRQI